MLRKTVFKPTQALFQYLPPPADEWEVPRSRLTLGDKLGEGQFGQVFVGTVVGGLREFSGRVTVAAKQSRLEISLADIKDYFAEASMMKRFSHPHHPNVCAAFC